MKKPSKEEKRLIRLYKKLRLATVDVEQLIEDIQSQNFIKLTPKPKHKFSGIDLHRLDKAVVVSKVAYKMIKRILKKHGFKGLKSEAMREENKKREK